MIKNIEGVLIFSENAKKLAGFYKDKVGLKLEMEAVMGENDEEVYGFKIGQGTTLAIMDHSKVKGINKQPERMMFNLEVDDIETEVKRMDKAGVKKVADIYHIQDYGHVATFADADGNYFQLVQTQQN